MRRRLLLVTVATTTMVAIAFVVPLGMLVRTFARDRALAAAEAEARSLAPALAVTQDPAAVGAAVGATGAGAEGRMAVRLPDGTWVGRPLAPGLSLDTARSGRAVSVRVGRGARILLPVVLGRRGTAIVVVDVPPRTLERGVDRSWAILAAVAVALVALAVIVADVLARGVVRPVERLAQAAAAIGAGDLATRTPPEGPAEVADVARAFNAMAGRIGGLLLAERETVADLSHRLRTPLTRLRLDAEGLTGPGAATVAADVDALEDEVNALIAEARAPVTGNTACDATTVVSERVEFWSALADEEGRAWRVSLKREPCPVQIAAADLAAAVDVLLGNVFAHTPEGTAFSVRLERDGDLVVLVISDDGPGFPAAAAARGVSGSGSTGLGLDIARRVAESAGGRMEVRASRTGGAEVALFLRRTGDAISAR